jgi:hypothetical protein
VISWCWSFKRSWENEREGGSFMHEQCTSSSQLHLLAATTTALALLSIVEARSCFHGAPQAGAGSSRSCALALYHQAGRRLSSSLFSRRCRVLASPVDYSSFAHSLANCSRVEFCWALAHLPDSVSLSLADKIVRVRRFQRGCSPSPPYTPSPWSAHSRASSCTGDARRVDRWSFLRRSRRSPTSPSCPHRRVRPRRRQPPLFHLHLNQVAELYRPFVAGTENDLIFFRKC